VAAGALFVAALLLSPRHGVVTKAVRRAMLSLDILVDDVIALLYRIEETDPARLPVKRDSLQRVLMVGPLSLKIVLAWLRSRGTLELSQEGYALSDSGRQQAQELVRSHRLWEQYLATAAGVAPE